jgi:protein phosphatase PTC7
MQGMADEEQPLLGILERAYAELNRITVVGSCTVCLALLSPTGSLHVLNVGDSGLKIFRNHRVVFATADQQHSFNCPKQLGSGSCDLPVDGDYQVTQLDDGDMIVAGTDGVWDNVWDLECLQLVRAVEMESGDDIDMDALARTIAEVAHRHGADSLFYSPFAANARRGGYRSIEGGKLDDVTCVVARVAAVATQEGDSLEDADAQV